MSTQNEPSFAFYSQVQHDLDGGVHTCEYSDAARSVTVPANYCGSMVDGYPGTLIRGEIKRPPNYETFVCVGEIGPDHLLPTRVSPNADRMYADFLKRARHTRLLSPADLKVLADLLGPDGRRRLQRPKALDRR